jgi:peptidoglycan/LPS O-acetylase OafA/YrhL
MTTMNATLDSTAPMPQREKYNYSIGYLRAFIVALVVAHHSAAAYYPIALPLPKSLVEQPRLWTAFPVVDTHKWSGSALFIGFNDVFFMSLMFFLSGLFVWHSLATKRAANFLRDRMLRLGLPFVLAAAIVAPLAYYAAYLQISGHNQVVGFWHQWLSLGQWPAGPAWFIWVLLAFDCIATLLFLITPQWGEALGALTSRAAVRPVVVFGGLVAISGLAYIPMALHFSPVSWSAFGPFAFQTSRIFHYLVYFLIGIGVGARGLDSGLLAPDGKLARHWLLWVIAALIVFGGATMVTLMAFMPGNHAQAFTMAMNPGFVLSCAASCFAFLAIFLRFARSRSRLFDSLNENSYAIYLVHYAFVAWIQFALLPESFPGALKAALVFLGALALSWGTAVLVRRIPAVKRLV